MKIVIIDCGFGNHENIRAAISKLGIKFTNDIDALDKKDIILIPGVGNFKNSMDTLKSKKLDKFILDHHKNNGRIVGICLGMQLLFDFGYEGGGCDGLSLIEGEVSKINKIVKNERPIFGWKKINHLNKKLTEFDKPMYFVHSYSANCKDKSNIESFYFYQGRKIISSVKSNNVYGFQFHPERSAEYGLKILEKVLNMNF